jgi:hypothetical protein
MQIKRIAMAVFVLLLLVTPALLVVSPAAAQTARQRFQWVIAQRLTVTTAGIEVTAGDVDVVEGVTAADVTASDDAVVGDDLTTTGNVIYTTPARVSLGVTSTLAPVSANVPISASASSGVLITCASGAIYHIYNVGTQTIKITDSLTMKLESTVTLGNSDSITLIGDGTNCVEITRSNS